MFKKIISQIPYSPSMIHNLGFYAGRLRKKEATRKIGLVLTALALVVQAFTVFSSPESANAADSSDLIYGGISNGSQLMAHYDANTNNIRDLYNHLGIPQKTAACPVSCRTATTRGHEPVLCVSVRGGGAGLHAHLRNFAAGD